MAMCIEKYFEILRQQPAAKGIHTMIDNSVGYSMHEDEYLYYLQYGKLPLYRLNNKDKYKPEIVDYLLSLGFAVMSHKSFTWEEKIFLSRHYGEGFASMIEITISNDGQNYACELFCDSQAGLDQIVKEFHSSPTPLKINTEHSVGILKNEYGDLTIDYIEIPKPTLDMALNYGEKFVEIDEKITTKLKENKKGLYLLSGEPGTGKTTYLRHLMTTLKRKLIIVPNNLIGQLDGPNFISLLMNHKRSAIIIEDSESVLQSREEGNGIAPTIINMTDGIMGDILNVAIIATFNVAKQTIDKALLRKGRLHFEYEFKALSVGDSQKLLDHLSIDHKATKAMTLAEIYNLYDDNGRDYNKKEEKKIGFVTN